MKSPYPGMKEYISCMLNACPKSNKKEIDFNKIIKFLNEKEGFKKDMYVPIDNDGNPGRSGPTIATGIDIGQLLEFQIDNLKISDQLKDKLYPYAGFKGPKAVSFVKANPLKLSEAEANELNQAFIPFHINHLAAIYTENSCTHFSNLPPQAQLVISSVSHQFGEIEKIAKKFWKAVTQQNWEKAAEELRNWNGPGKPDKYLKRRESEAQLFDEIKKLKSRR